jgi:ATP-binding cassette subfamily G (WHITE) protein 2 (SNQ2)
MHSLRSASLHLSCAQGADLFTNCIQMPTMMLGRPIADKQIGYGFYRPAALVFANFFADIPFSAVRVFIFDVIVYFMPGLWVISLNLTFALPHFALRARSAGGFFTFHMFVYLTFVAMQGLFRTFGLLCTSFDGAFRLATIFLPNVVQYAGYMIPTFQMKRWLFWIVSFVLFFAETFSLANRAT